MSEPENARVEQIPCISLLDVFRTIASAPVCVGNRWKCDNGHEWDTAHGDVWLQMPITCPECGHPGVAHMGRWQTLNDSVKFGNSDTLNAPADRAAVADTVTPIIGASESKEK